MRKVRLTCHWCSDEVLYERCERVYKTKYYPLNFNATLDDDYDLLVTINKPIYDKKTSVLGVIMEPTWWFSSNKKDQLYQTCDHVISHSNTSLYSNNIFYPGTLPYHLTYNNGQGLDYYLTNNFYNKPKKCSFIVSMKSHKWNGEMLYNQRIQLVYKILETDLPIDIYGRGWDNSKHLDERIKGDLDVNNKIKGLQDYKYSICIENTVEESYFTEKITDCLLVNTIPIYYGCDHINNFFKTPISLSNINTVQEINEILHKQYEFNEEDKLALGTKYNLYVAISKYIEQFI